MNSILRVAEFVILLCVTSPCCLLSQEYPFLSKVQITATVSYNLPSHLFFYSYQVSSDQSNKGTILFIDLDISRGQHTMTYDTVGLTFDSKLSESYFREHYPHLMGGIVPVGFPRLPNEGWYANIGGVFAEATMSTDSLGIVPGQRVSDIVISSRALPGIRKIRFEPEFQDGIYFPYDDTTNTDDIDSIRYAIKFRGWTVAPTAPPVNFEATSWCDTLVNYTLESETLGWIKDRPTATKYLAYFSSARSKLEQHDSVGVRTVLQQVLREVESDSAVHLSSEAYALLRFNTEYLVDKLPTHR